MKKILLFIVCALGLVASKNAMGQSIYVADTVYATVNSSMGSTTIESAITNLTGNGLNLRWSVVSTNFPSDWLNDTALSICDDIFCRSNASGQLWNGTTGTIFWALYPGNSSHADTGDYHMLLNLTYATSIGPHYMTVRITDTSTSYSTSTTFVINRWPTAISNVNNPATDIVVYPNPAHDEINIVYDPNDDIKNIVVYNIIGKSLSVYKATDNSSANLNIENIPSGIYFMRLFNSHGDVVVTRKFTKQ